MDQSVKYEKNPTHTFNFKKKSLAKRMWKERWLYILLLPGLIYLIVYKYLPIWGLIMAFQDYKPHLGFWDSPWVGMKHFNRFFSEPQFWMLLKNTLIIALYNMIFFFPLTIILGLLLNEVRKESYKRFVQSVTYLPHFLSWVVVVSISYKFLTTEGGVVNSILQQFGSEKINFMMSKEWFRPLIVLQGIWKDMGWGSIIILAALAGVDIQLYESAIVEGANRLHRLWYITLPSIQSTIVILLILRLGRFLDLGFEQIFLMLNAMNREIGEVFDTYVYMVGISMGQFSYSVAVGLFKSLVGLILVMGSNYIAKKFGEEGVY